MFIGDRSRCAPSKNYSATSLLARILASSTVDCRVCFTFEAKVTVFCSHGSPIGAVKQVTFATRPAQYPRIFQPDCDFELCEQIATRCEPTSYNERRKTGPGKKLWIPRFTTFCPRARKTAVQNSRVAPSAMSSTSSWHHLPFAMEMTAVYAGLG